MIKNKSDFEAHDLARQLWEVSNGAFPALSPWTEAQFYGDLTNTHSVYFISERKGRVVAYLSLHLILDEAEVVNVAVHGDFKRQGLALSLFQAALDFLRGQHVHQFFLEVREHNLPALTLYQKIGFQIQGRRKNYYHQPVEDGLMMTYTFETERGQEQ